MANREYKSGVFSLLMKEKEYAMKTYNALNGTDYNDPELVEIGILNEGVTLSVRNDASFYINSYVNMYEHQSTKNPNMPLRMLKYYSDLMWKYVKKKDYDIYGERRVMLPTPKFVVFYNGAEKMPAVSEYLLSDCFQQREDVFDINLKVAIYNINPGYNDKLLEDSVVLMGYTTFVEKVRKYRVEYQDLETAINTAIDECIDEGILAEFFRDNREEVVRMTVIDCTFEQREKWIARDNFEMGREEGFSEGQAEAKKEAEKQIAEVAKEADKVIASMISSAMKGNKESFDEVCDLLGVKEREKYKDLV